MKYIKEVEDILAKRIMDYRSMKNYTEQAKKEKAVEAFHDWMKQPGYLDTALLYKRYTAQNNLRYVDGQFYYLKDGVWEKQCINLLKHNIYEFVCRHSDGNYTRKMGLIIKMLRVNL